MQILHNGTAGTLESSDALVSIERNPSKGVMIELESITESRFGNQIRKVVEETLKELKIDDALVTVKDRSALDCTIRARLITAAYRAAGIKTVKWEELP